MNFSVGIHVLVQKEDKFLIIKRNENDPDDPGCWDLPGGGIKFKENPYVAAVREVKEECNLDITDLRYFGSFGNLYNYRGVDYFTADTFFLCRPVDIKKLRLSKEASEVVLAEIKEFNLNKIAFDSIKAALKKYKNGKMDIC